MPHWDVSLNELPVYVDDHVAGKRTGNNHSDSETDNLSSETNLSGSDRAVTLFGMRGTSHVLPVVEFWS
jgi:hypothetical protein